MTRGMHLTHFLQRFLQIHITFDLESGQSNVNIMHH